MVVIEPCRIQALFPQQERDHRILAAGIGLDNVPDRLPHLEVIQRMGMRRPEARTSQQKIASTTLLSPSSADSASWCFRIGCRLGRRRTCDHCGEREHGNPSQIASDTSPHSPGGCVHVSPKKREQPDVNACSACPGPRGLRRSILLIGHLIPNG